MITDNNDYTLPSNPKDREKIKANILDITDLMHQKAAIEATIKEKEVSMKDELGIPTKITKRLAKTLYKEQTDGNEFDKINTEHEAFYSAFDILFRGSQSTVNDSEEEDLDDSEED